MSVYYSHIHGLTAIFNLLSYVYIIIRKVQGNQVGLKLNGTHQLLVYANDMNLIGDNTDNMKENTLSLPLVRRVAY
jgi:hypothetical protein